MSNGFTYFNEEWNEPAPKERKEIITNEERYKRKQALIELIRLDEELGLYDMDYTDNPLIRK
jgi:hypothetical protein